MIKALMIISMLGGNVYEVEYKDWDSCISYMEQVRAQDAVENVSCIPRNDEAAMEEETFRKFLGMFNSMVKEIKRQRRCEDGHFYSPNYNECG